MSSVKEYRKDILAGDFASICVEFPTSVCLSGESRGQRSLVYLLSECQLPVERAGRGEGRCTEGLKWGDKKNFPGGLVVKILPSTAGGCGFVVGS